MSTVQSPTAPKPSKRRKSDVEYVEYDRYIDRQVERTRKAVKLVDLSQAVLVLVIGLLAFLLTAALIEHWIVPGGRMPKRLVTTANTSSEVRADSA